MAIIALFAATDHSAEQYDEVIGAFAARGLANPDGRLFHVAWASPEGWNVLDVWESEEKLAQIGDALKSVVENAGGTPMPPQVFPVHNMIS